MRGRKPKPTSSQIAAGDPRKKGVRKLQERLEAEPSATRGLPDCPEHLRGRAVAAWAFWVEELADMNLDRRPDAMMLEGACVNYARAVDADCLLSDAGFLYDEPITNKQGEIVGYKTKAHPAVGISNAAWRQVRAFCSEFGLSPVSRTRLSIERKDSLGDLASLLAEPRVPRPVVH
jgi:P27 family predicted phage terminase small subunit